MEPLTPLERARMRSKCCNRKTCPTCEDREEIDGVSYCRKSGKLLHPYLLDARYTARCPHEIEEERISERRKEESRPVSDRQL